MTSLIATDPSLLAERDERLPLKLPMGVRTELTMKTSFPLEPFPKLLAGQESLERLRRELTGLQPDLKLEAIFNCLFTDKKTEFYGDRGALYLEIELLLWDTSRLNAVLKM